MVHTFRYFIRKNFPEVANKISNKVIDEISVEFHEYLDTKLSDEQKQKILPKNAMEVIMNSSHPFKKNGFEPSYVLHFIKWIENKMPKTIEGT